MKIIKDGDLERLKAIRRFTCWECWCVWEADKTEYESLQTEYNDISCSMNCPCCGNRTFGSPRPNGVAPRG